MFLSLLRLVTILTIVTLVYEIGHTHYQAYANSGCEYALNNWVDTTILGIKMIGVNILTKSIWNFKFVGMLWWIFSDKLYLVLGVCIVLAILNEFRLRQVRSERPEIIAKEKYEDKNSYPSRSKTETDKALEKHHKKYAEQLNKIFEDKNYYAKPENKAMYKQVAIEIEQKENNILEDY